MASGFKPGVTISCIVFNVNTIDIIGKLEKDPALRESVVQQAEAFTKAHPNLDQERVNELKNNSNPVNFIKPGSSTTQYSKQDSLARKNQLDSMTIAKNDSLIKRGKVLEQRAELLVKGDISKLNGVLGLGWSNMLKSHQYNVPKNGKWDNVPHSIQYIYEWLVVIFKWLVTCIGWLITALALSLGAPFWFDLLNKLMKLRSSATISTSSQSKGKEEEANTTPVIRKG